MLHWSKNSSAQDFKPVTDINETKLIQNKYNSFIIGLFTPLVINFSCTPHFNQESKNYANINYYFTCPSNEKNQQADSNGEIVDAIINSEKEFPYKLISKSKKKYNFNIAVLYDSSYTRHRNWESRFTKAIEALNKSYSKFDIVFNISSLSHYEIFDSIYINSKTFHDLATLRTAKQGNNANFVILFSAKKFRYFSGKALVKKRVMIVCTADKKYEKKIVVHEMGHLFGLPHAVNKKSNNYMRMVTTDSKAKSFIPENESIINIFRERNTLEDTLSFEVIKKRLPILLSIYKRYKTDHIILQQIGKSFFEISKHDSALLYFLKEKDYLDNLNYTRKDSIFEFYEECYRNIGLTYFKLDSQSLSVDFFKDRFQIMPEDTAAYFSIGKTFGEIAGLVLQERSDVSRHTRYWKESLNALELAYQQRSLNPELHFLYGLACYNTGYLSKAINAYNKSISLKNDFVESYYNLGLTYFQSDSMYAALRVFNDAIRIKSDYLEAYFGLGNAYYELALWEEAKAAYKEVVKIKPDFAKAHFNLGLTYLYIGDEESAFKQCEILKKLDPDLAERFCNNLDKSIK